ncbi:P-loop containing nucleoside triphosphate hydrolase protein [Geopyxis carbonaria]|nr:P-loop containing nucleoside triphosphate hydrolase protein [Geopyxis carbonaria]
MKAKTYSALQKTYDQSYLTCSTAVYYESLGNETEALRCWRECLGQLQSYTTMSAYHKPRSETEKALLRSLKSMKEQCENRAGLLQAMLLSRSEADNSASSSFFANNPHLGTPLSPPALPARSVTTGPATNALRPPPPPASASSSSATSLGIRPATVPAHGISPKISRTPSPDRTDRRTFLSTLRPARRKSKRAPEPGDTLKQHGKPRAAAQAATMAWTSISRNEGASIAQSLNLDRPAPTTSASTGDLPVTNGRRPSISDYDWDRDDVARERERPPTVRRVGTLKTRPASMIIPMGHSAPSSPNYETPPPPPPHRIPVVNIPPRKPAVPHQQQNEGKKLTPPPVPPKQPSLRLQANPETLRTDSMGKGRERGRKRSMSEGTESPWGADTDRSTESLPRTPVDQVSYPSSQEDPNGSRPSTVDPEERAWTERIEKALKSIGKGVDVASVRQVANEIVVKGDEVHWEDVAGLEGAKNALKEAVVYPFLRPDLFMGLREPARGMLLFGPPGTGKTMLARAVATESRSTFFSISASSLTSKYLGESEKLVRALFALAKALAPSIIFVDEIDSLLSSRGGSESEATRRIKTEFLIQWSDLARAAAGRDNSAGDASRVLVLAATNLPWAIDDAARRRFVRRQYIPLPEVETRRRQFENLIRAQKHKLGPTEMEKLVELTDGYSGSDITALAKDAAMGPLRSLGEKLLMMTMDEIRPIELTDFEKSMESIRPSVSKEGLKAFEEWATKYGERVR